MGGSDGIDVVLLHRHQILNQFLPVRHSACHRAEIVPVDTLENNALTIEQHQPVTQLKPAETDLLLHYLSDFTVLILYLNQKLIEFRDFRTPERRCINCKNRCGWTVFSHRCIALSQQLSIPHQLNMHGPAPFACGSNAYRSGGIVICKFRHNRQICNRRMRQTVQEDIAKDSGKPVKVLIFEPASRCPLEDAHCYPVFSFVKDICETKVCRVKTVFTVADISSVYPKGKAAFHTLKRNINVFPFKPLRQGKV